MYTKIFLALIVVWAFIYDFHVTPSYAAYDPSSQSWGAASITGGASNTCTINRLKSGQGPLYPWVTCSFNTATATFTLTWASGMFPLPPICELTAVGNPLVFNFTTDPTTSGATIVDQTLLGVLSTGTFFITCR